MFIPSHAPISEVLSRLTPPPRRADFRPGTTRHIPPKQPSRTPCPHPCPSAARHVFTTAKFTPSFCASSYSSWAGMLWECPPVPYGGAGTQGEGHGCGQKHPLRRRRLGIPDPPSKSHSQPRVAGTTSQSVPAAPGATTLLFPGLGLPNVSCRQRAHAWSDKRQRGAAGVLSTPPAPHQDQAGGWT